MLFRQTESERAELPLHYFDGSSVLAFFVVPRALAEAKVDTRYFRLGMHWEQKAVVGMGFYDFRDSELGSYHEVGLAIPVLPRGHAGPELDITSLVEMFRPSRKRRTGLCVLNLPVTTEPARAAGCDHWGYPKFVTSIAWQEGRNRFECEVGDPDVPSDRIVSLRGSLGHGLPAPTMNQVLFSRHEGETLRTEIEIGGRTRIRSGRGLALRVGKSAHAMATNLRDLGLDGARPALVMHTQRFTSILPAGVSV